MSAAWRLVCLLAIFLSPLAQIECGADELAASLTEQADPGVIDPVESPCPCGDLHAMSVKSVVDVDDHLLALTPCDFTFDLALDLAPPLSRTWIEPLPRPSGAISRARRLSLLQTFVI